LTPLFPHLSHCTISTPLSSLLAAATALLSLSSSPVATSNSRLCLHDSLQLLCPFAYADHHQSFGVLTFCTIVVFFRQQRIQGRDPSSPTVVQIIRFGIESLSL
jgi:hypothetical protein